jgi:hypothetical protein
MAEKGLREAGDSGEEITKFAQETRERDLEENGHKSKN